jgi:hypothetical protein
MGSRRGSNWRGCQKCAVGAPCSFTHGTRTGHDYHGCRCEVCTAAQRDRDRRRYWQNPEKFRERKRGGRPRRIRPDGQEGRRIRDHEYHERNRAYRLRRSHRYYANRAEIPTPRGGRPWTAADDAVVLDDELFLTEMCYLLGRSYSAVNNRRVLLRRRREEAA